MHFMRNISQSSEIGEIMQDFGEAFRVAMQLVASGNADLVEIIGLSLRVSLSAMVVSCLIGFPLGAILAISRF
ncbi:MAG: hypothetical protein R3322_18845, partial [Kiloniellales bacterium]|nr:hypothetical protein [Kiloniellales bacterium]